MFFLPEFCVESFSPGISANLFWHGIASSQNGWAQRLGLSEDVSIELGIEFGCSDCSALLNPQFSEKKNQSLCCLSSYQNSSKIC